MDAKSSTVLVADDDFGVVEAIADGLVSRGFQVIKAWSARHALSILLTEKVDVLVAQSRMRGDCDPMGFAGEAIVTWPHLAVVVTTVGDNAVRVSAPGRVSLLHRPFNLASLLVAVAKSQAMVTIGQRDHLAV